MSLFSGETIVSPTITGLNLDGSHINNMVVDSGGTLTVTDADSLTVGAKIVPVTWTVKSEYDANAVDKDIWVANRACKVVSVKEIHSVAGDDAGTVSVIPRKITDTSAPGATAGTTVKELIQSAFNLKSTANTTVTGTLSATAGDYTFAAGNRLSLNFAGTLTTLAGGLIVVEFQAV